MKKELNPAYAVIAGVALLVVALFFGIRYVNNSGSLDHGQIKYTPGVPPWQEKGVKSGGSSPVPAPAIGNGNSTGK